MNHQTTEDPARAAESLDRLEVVMRYHQETKHHFSRYARSLGYLDWANQPNPFRRFEGSPLISLPLLKLDDAPLSPLYEDLYRLGAIASAPVTVRTLSRFFEYALAISAWKQAGEVRWALRSNPSSGNLHPTEGYLLIDTVPSLSPFPGLYHYASKDQWAGAASRVAEGKLYFAYARIPAQHLSCWLYLCELADARVDATHLARQGKPTESRRSRAMGVPRPGGNRNVEVEH